MVKKIMQLVSPLHANAGGETGGEIKRQEPESVTVSASVETAAAQGGGAAEPDKAAAETERVLAIMDMAGPGQEKLCRELVAGKKSRGEAAEAFLKDVKAKTVAAPVQPPQTQFTKEELAQELLKAYSAAAPASVSTSGQSEPNVYAKYMSIGDPAERQRFYAAHKAEIDEIANKQKKEAK
jgi:hypothetical protein